MANVELPDEVEVAGDVEMDGAYDVVGRYRCVCGAVWRCAARHVVRLDAAEDLDAPLSLNEEYIICIAQNQPRFKGKCDFRASDPGFSAEMAFLDPTDIPKPFFSYGLFGIIRAL